MDEQSLFLQALEQPAGEHRRRWLSQACEDDAVCARVAALVDRHEEAGNFLDRPAVEMLKRVDDAAADSESRTLKRITKEKFIDRLVRSKLMTAEDVAECESTFETLRSAPDAQSYAQAMVKAKKLTRFQARAIYDGRIKGLTLGEYVILDQLGKGGMGIVYKAQHRRMDRIVAIKVLPRFAMSTDGAVNRFYREVKAAAKLMHPNIVAALDAGEDDGLHYLVMEFVDGHDLGELQRRTGALPPDQAVNFVVQAARGLQFAHEQGVIHRDIKPANLLIDRNGAVKILDMGLARVTADDGDQEDNSPNAASATETIAGATFHGSYETVSLDQEAAPVTDETRLTRAGEVLGTLDYMPPEQFTNTRAVDERGDIYSLGCTLYRLLTNERPFPVDTVGAIFNAHHQAPVPPLRSACAEISPPLEAVFKRMLAKEPGQRQASMTQVIEELEAAISSEQASSQTLAEPIPQAAAESQFDPNSRATPAPQISTPPRAKSPGQFRRRRRKRTAWGAGAGLVLCTVLIVCVLAVALTWMSDQEETPASGRSVASADSPGSSDKTDVASRRDGESAPNPIVPTPAVSKNDASDDRQPTTTFEPPRQPSSKQQSPVGGTSAVNGSADVVDKETQSEPVDVHRSEPGREGTRNSATEEATVASSGSGRLDVERGAVGDSSDDSKLPGGFSFGTFGNRNVTFVDNGREISLSENDRGISVSIDGRVVTAADAAELKAKDAEAYKLYQKTFGASFGPDIKLPFGRSANNLQRKQLEQLRDQNLNNPQLKAMFERMLRETKKATK